ncbi:MAG TPA: AAA family ATPase [Mucilaginibacter sp.]|jgi:predicted AAA+ superfamily ATPase
MEPLLLYQDNLLKTINNSFRRYLLPNINWNQRMIGIKGPRGAGKTTMMLQHLKFDLKDLKSKALYVTADHTWFYNHTLLDTAMDWFKQGGRILFIDEVHKYPQWSRELKNIYDGLPEMRVVFSASSALDIYRGESDLSRRVISHTLAGLSFREYLAFTENLFFDPVSLQDLRSGHRDLSMHILEKLQPLPLFNKYLKNGYLPIIAEGEAEYLPRLEQVINAIVDTDLAYIASYNAGTAVKVKRLLGVIAESAPFKPNMSAIARKLEIHRESIYEYIYQLKDARLLNILSTEGKGVSRLQKPDKIFLENTNFAYAINPSPDKGNIRETFLLNQLINTGADVYAPVTGDFLTSGLTIEVGGKSKTSKQVKNTDAYLVAADDIETGFGIKAPLWLFGFLY